MIKQCLICDKEFDSNRKDKKFCSHKCNSLVGSYKQLSKCKIMTFDELIGVIRNRTQRESREKKWTADNIATFNQAAVFVKKLKRVDWQLRTSDVIKLTMLYSDMFDNDVHPNTKIENQWCRMIIKMVAKLKRYEYL